MATAPALPATPGRPQSPAQAKRNWLSEIKDTGNNEKPKIVIAGQAGVGKTSLAAHSTKPVFIMTGGETGLETLIDAKQVSPVPHFPATKSWLETTGCVESLLTGDHDRQTLVIDAGNGAEKQLHEYVCQRDYNGEFGKSGFSSYMQGYDVALADWRLFLASLDRLRTERKMTVIILCHVAVRPYKNPLGSDYDRITPDMHPKTWGLTMAWSDIVLFCDFFVSLEKDGARVKAKGGQQRIMYTTHHAGYDAKNRHGLPEEIDMGESGSEAWKNFTEAFKAGRKGGA